MMMKRRSRIAAATFLLAIISASWHSNAAADDHGSGQNSLPKGQVRFRFSAYANNVMVLPPLVADFQLGVSRITGAGIIQDGKVSGAFDDVDQLRLGTRSLKAKIIDGSYSEVGLARILTLTVEITESSHPTDEAKPGVKGTLVIQDSPYLLKNNKEDDTVGLGSWDGEVRTHIHGYNNEDPGPRTAPPTGGPPNGGQWADVEIGGPAGDVAGTWKSEYGPVTLHVQNGNVTGTWDQGDGKIGKIVSGTYDSQSGALAFKYSQDWNNENGTTTFRLSLDGQRLTGTWTQSSGSGAWTLTR